MCAVVSRESMAHKRALSKHRRVPNCFIPLHPLFVLTCRLFPSCVCCFDFLFYLSAATIPLPVILCYFGFTFLCFPFSFVSFVTLSLSLFKLSFLLISLFYTYPFLFSRPRPHPPPPLSLHRLFLDINFLFSLDLINYSIALW